MSKDESTSPPIRPATMEFYGTTLSTAVAEDDAQLYVPVRQLCGCLGVDSTSELRRIRAAAALAEGLRALVVPQPDGRLRKMLCLRVDLVPGWLIGTSLAGVKDQTLRQKLQTYQRQACQVAWQVFGPETAAPVAEAELAAIAGRMEVISQRLHAIARFLASRPEQAQSSSTSDSRAESETGGNPDH
jgi:hypothetical protein